MVVGGGLVDGIISDRARGEGEGDDGCLVLSLTLSMKSITSLAPDEGEEEALDSSVDEDNDASAPFSPTAEAEEEDALLAFKAARRATAISCNVSCMNPATARRACNSFFMFSSFCKSFCGKIVGDQDHLRRRKVWRKMDNGWLL